MARARAGEFRRLMTLCRESSTNFDTRGQPSNDPVELGQLWAKMEPISAQEAPLVEMMEGVVTHKITVRYTTNLDGGITRKHWLTWKGRRFDIGGVRDIDGETALLELMCGEQV